MTRLPRVRCAHQVPSTWRSLIEDPATLQLMLDFYVASTPPLSNTALECLVRIIESTACLLGTLGTPIYPLHVYHFKRCIQVENTPIQRSKRILTSM